MDGIADEIVSKLLDAPLRPQAFQALADALALRFGAMSVAAVSIDLKQAWRDVLFSSSFHRGDAASITDRCLDALDQEDADAYARLMRRPLHQLVVEPRLHRLETTAPPRPGDVLHQAPVIRHRAMLHLGAGPDRSALLLLDLHAPLAPGDARLFERFSPLIARSLRLHRAFDALHARCGAMLAALAQLGLGVLLLDGGGSAPRRLRCGAGCRR